MQVLKFGTMNPMIPNPTFGLWVVFFTSLSALSHLLGPETCKDCTKKLQEDIFQG